VAQLPVFWSLFNVLRGIAAWHPGVASPYGIPVSVVESARAARIFGATLADKVLFTDGMSVPITAQAVIVVAVLISAVTTFLTMRQSQKRGMMQQPTADPDNPAANMQKYMMYVAPLFALSGLYWQFGLVIYWVTTNVWTLGQQHFLFRNLPVVGANADSATAPATGGAKNTAARTGGTVAKSGAAKTGAAKTGTAARAATAAKPAGKAAASGKAAPAGKSGVNGSSSDTKGNAQETSNGTGARNLLRFGKGKPEPEPEPAAEAKVVRQQPVRQTRSKRSGKR
jgi:YidC/Oxa1 family membrane protein insertase